MASSRLPWAAAQKTEPWQHHERREAQQGERRCAANFLVSSLVRRSCAARFCDSLFMQPPCLGMFASYRRWHDQRSDQGGALWQFSCDDPTLDWEAHCYRTFWVRSGRAVAAVDMIRPRQGARCLPSWSCACSCTISLLQKRPVSNACDGMRGLDRGRPQPALPNGSVLWSLVWAAESDLGR